MYNVLSKGHRLLMKVHFITTGLASQRRILVTIPDAMWCVLGISFVTLAIQGQPSTR